jgi:N-acetylglucosamine-6-phosphate deacetylase
MTSLLSARRLITANEVVEWPRVALDADGNIESIEPGETSAEETTLTVAFFDIHIHGAAGHDVMEGSAEALKRVGGFLATKGVANYLATTVTAPVERTLRALDGIAAAIEAAEYSGETFAAKPIGIHLEGPFISHAKRGVHPPGDIQPPSIALFDRLQQAARGHIRLMTIAPEVPGALELIEYATRAGVRISLGHTDATAAQTYAAIAAGARSATHTFNAMRRLAPAAIAA